MRYPILTKLISVALCICCLALLVSGIYGVDKAEEDRETENLKLQEVNKKAEDFLSIDKALSGKLSYAEAKKELEAREQSYKEAASEHKKQLTEYSATKGGLTMGSEAMDEAEFAMEELKVYYEEGSAQLAAWEAALPEMEEALRLGREQYEAGLPLYNFACSAVNSIRGLLDELFRFDAIMDSDDACGRLELSLEAYDRLIAIYEETLGGVWELEARGLISAELLQAAEERLIAATGMSSVDILNLLYSARDDIASGADGGLTEEEFLVIKEIYYANRELLMSAASSAEELLIEADWQLQLMGSQLESAEEQLQQGEYMLNMANEYMPRLKAMLGEMKLAMEQGGDALIEARNEMAAKFGELDTSLQELRQEKERLSEESDEIDALKAETEERKELESRRTSISVSLRDIDEIRVLYEEGKKIPEAVKIYAADKLVSIEKVYNGSVLACSLMIAAAVIGILALIPIFGKKKHSRAGRIILPGLCLVLVLAAEGISYYNSLGHIYSALTVSVLSTMVLLAAIPNKKKKLSSI